METSTLFFVALLSFIVLLASLLILVLIEKVQARIYRIQMWQLMKQDAKCAAFLQHLTGILAHGQTPYILVDATVNGVKVPNEYVKNGEITLDISPKAIRFSSAVNGILVGHARFDGIALSFAIPVSAIKFLVTKETGTGVKFNDNPDIPVDTTQQA
jgi:stringent starvation protein B